MRTGYRKQLVWTPRQSILNGFLLLALLFVLAGCGGDDLAENQVRLACNDSCAERAQCGTREDGTPVVFLKRDNADVNNHDLAIPVGTVGTIMATQGNQVVELANGNQFTVTFYQLLLSDQVTQGWITEWCVEQ